MDPVVIRKFEYKAKLFIIANEVYKIQECKVHIAFKEMKPSV